MKNNNFSRLLKFILFLLQIQLARLSPVPIFVSLSNDSTLWRTAYLTHDEGITQKHNDEGEAFTSEKPDIFKIANKQLQTISINGLKVVPTFESITPKLLKENGAIKVESTNSIIASEAMMFTFSENSVPKNLNRPISDKHYHEICYDESEITSEVIEYGGSACMYPNNNSGGTKTISVTTTKEIGGNLQFSFQNMLSRLPSFTGSFTFDVYTILAVSCTVSKGKPFQFRIEQSRMKASNVQRRVLTIHEHIFKGDYFATSEWENAPDQDLLYGTPSISCVDDPDYIQCGVEF